MNQNEGPTQINVLSLIASRGLYFGPLRVTAATLFYIEMSLTNVSCLEARAGWLVGAPFLFAFSLGNLLANVLQELVVGK